MGRRKLNMELRINEKSRNLTFKKRKAGLIKKLQELTTLCEVKACMVLYGPQGSGVEPEIWPQNRDETGRILEDYRAKKKGCNKFDLGDYFSMRKTEVEKEVKKIREKKNEAKYPIPAEMLNRMKASELREFGAVLKNRAEFVKSRIQLLRESSNKLVQGGFDFGNAGDFDVSRLYLLMNGDDEFGIGGASTSTNSMGVECYNSWLSSDYYQPPLPPQLESGSTAIDFGNSGDLDDSRLLLLMNGDDEFVGASTSSMGVVCNQPPLPPPASPPYAAAAPLQQLHFFPIGWENDDADYSPDDILNYYMGLTSF